MLREPATAVAVAPLSLDPFAARCLRVYGRAGEPVERVSELVGPGLFMRITPSISWSWNLADNPAGDTWYEPRRTVHQGPRSSHNPSIQLD